MGDTHITGRHIGGGTHITSDMCAGIHISRGYTYHCDSGLGINCTREQIGLFSNLHEWLPQPRVEIIKKSDLFTSTISP